MLDTRVCEQCRSAFEPQREHARFCSAHCRVTWNREHTDGEDAGDSALAWSVTAMAETVTRLAKLQVNDPPQAFEVISEAVWWVTIVDATLVRYHHAAYDRVLTAKPPASRRVTEDTFAGLRFVRNRMGYHAAPSQFIQPDAEGCGPVAAWTWRPLPPPELTGLSAQRADWAMSRYHAYQTQLAGRPVGTTFEQAAAFLDQAATTAASGQRDTAG